MSKRRLRLQSQKRVSRRQLTLQTVRKLFAGFTGWENASSARKACGRRAMYAPRVTPHPVVNLTRKDQTDAQASAPEENSTELFVRNCSEGSACGRLVSVIGIILPFSVKGSWLRGRRKKKRRTSLRWSHSLKRWSSSNKPFTYQRQCLYLSTKCHQLFVPNRQGRRKQIMPKHGKTVNGL